MIDAHVHGDLVLLADPYHEPAVRQGVTTYIMGQDGVAIAPGSNATLDYMRNYTAGFNGNFPTPGRSWCRWENISINSKATAQSMPLAWSQTATSGWK